MGIVDVAVIVCMGDIVGNRGFGFVFRFGGGRISYSGFREVPKNAQAVTLVMGVSSFGFEAIWIEQGLPAS